MYVALPFDLLGNKKMIVCLRFSASLLDSNVCKIKQSASTLKYTATPAVNRSVGVVVEAVNVGFISMWSCTEDFKRMFTNFLLHAKHERDCVEKKPASSLVSSGSALSKYLHLYVAY